MSDYNYLGVPYSLVNFTSERRVSAVTTLSLVDVVNQSAAQRWRIQLRFVPEGAGAAALLADMWARHAADRLRLTMPQLPGVVLAANRTITIPTVPRVGASTIRMRLPAQTTLMAGTFIGFTDPQDAATSEADYVDKLYQVVTTQSTTNRAGNRNVQLTPGIVYPPSQNWTVSTCPMPTFHHAPNSNFGQVYNNSTLAAVTYDLIEEY